MSSFFKIYVDLLHKVLYIVYKFSYLSMDSLIPLSKARENQLHLAAKTTQWAGIWWTSTSRSSSCLSIGAPCVWSMTMSPISVKLTVWYHRMKWAYLDNTCRVFFSFLSSKQIFRQESYEKIVSNKKFSYHFINNINFHLKEALSLELVIIRFDSANLLHFTYYFTLY